MSLREFNDGALSKAIDLSRERARSYTYALVTFALLPGEDGYSIFSGRCLFARGQAMVSPCDYEYGDLRLIRRLLSPTEGLALVASLAPGSTLSIMDCPKARLSERWFWNVRRIRLPSGGFDHGLHLSDWPTDLLELLERQEPPHPTVKQPLGEPGLPLYPDLASAVLHFVFDRGDLLGSGSNLEYRRFQVILPEFRGRMLGASLVGNDLAVRVQRGTRTAASFVVRIYCETDVGIYQHEDCLKRGAVVFRIGHSPRYLLVQLIDARGRCVDEREVAFSWGRLPSDFVVAAADRDETVRQLIGNGEGRRIEFKRGFTPQRQKLLDSICAFANTAGGTVLLGIDDDGSIIGCDLSVRQLQDSLTDSIRNSIDPPATFSLERAIVDEKPLILVHVLEGADKPYVLRARGPLIRAGATNRPASRRELDQFRATKTRE